MKSTTQQYLGDDLPDQVYWKWYSRHTGEVQYTKDSPLTSCNLVLRHKGQDWGRVKKGDHIVYYESGRVCVMDDDLMKAILEKSDS